MAIQKASGPKVQTTNPWVSSFPRAKGTQAVKRTAVLGRKPKNANNPFAKKSSPVMQQAAQAIVAMGKKSMPKNMAKVNQ